MNKFESEFCLLSANSPQQESFKKSATTDRKV